jgi:hypothetical protein
MKTREYLLRDRVGSKEQIILLVPEKWLAPEVKTFIADPDYDIFELTHWSARMITPATIIMTILDWLNANNPENAEELYEIFINEN